MAERTRSHSAVAVRWRGEGAVTAGENRRPRLAPGSRIGVAGDVHPAMKGAQIGALQAPCDLSRVAAGVEELGVGEHVVLPGGDLRDAPLGASP